MALTDLLPESMADIYPLESIHGVEIEEPEPRYVVSVG